jgi:hypothetical protein
MLIDRISLLIRILILYIYKVDTPKRILDSK